MKLNSVKFKISVFYTSILGIILILFSISLYTTLYNTLYQELDEELKVKAELIKSSIDAYIEEFGIEEQNLILAARKVITLEGIQSTFENSNDSKIDWVKQYDKLDLSDDFIHFVSLDGEHYIKSNNIEKDLRIVFLKYLVGNAKDQYIFQKVKYGKKNLRLVQTSFFYNEKSEYVIQIATSHKPILELLEQRKIFLLISVPVIMCLTMIIGVYFSKSLMAPIVEITETAKEMSHEDLSRRLKSDYPDEEIHSLVQSFNDMFERLEKSFKHIGQFSSHVAHELKTPIAIMRGECEIALKKVRTPEEYQRVLKVNLEEAQRMLKTVEDLLLLARLDYKPEVFKFKPFDLIKFFEELSEQSKILASERNIDVKVTLPKPSLEGVGDMHHLRRLFLNIVHNAIKFTPKEGNISIEVTVKENKVITNISDSGIGIHPEDLPKVFNQFFQRENPDSETSESSNGLGLNISLSIAKLHQGDIQVQSMVGKGSTFIIILPILNQTT